MLRPIEDIVDEPLWKVSMRRRGTIGAGGTFWVYNDFEHAERSGIDAVVEKLKATGWSVYIGPYLSPSESVRRPWHEPC